jgi:hypothetical protein
VEVRAEKRNECHLEEYSERTANSFGARYVVHFIPDPAMLVDDYPRTAPVPERARRNSGSPWRAHSEALVRALDREGVVTIRDLSRMRKDARKGVVLYRGYIGHWTREGHRRAAEDIARVVAPLLLDRSARTGSGDRGRAPAPLEERPD